jgi:hypothetical protein
MTDFLSSARRPEKSGQADKLWPLVHGLAAGALALRLLVAWVSEHINHPDELFQYLEQAHRLVYGYGFIPWEYRFGIRNWLLPGTLAALLGALRAVGLDEPTLYAPMMRSVFAVVSVCVVYASYVIARNLFCELTGRFAAVFAAIWYELIYGSTMPTPEVLGAYAIVVALAITTGSASGRKASWAGLLLGVAVALRLQYAAPAAALWVLVLMWWGWRRALWVAGSAAAVVVFAGMLDAWSWGTPFISYYNSVVFNVVYGISSRFGEEQPLYYLAKLFVGSWGLFAIAAAYGIANWRQCWPILLLIASVLLPHSLIAHKEYRFVFVVVPLLLIFLADKFRSTTAPLLADRGNWVIEVAVAIVAAISVVGGAVTGVMGRYDRFAATLDLSRRSDVVAVLDLNGPWFASGGFYYLHHNVPFYFREHFDGIPITDVRLLASHVLLPAAQSPLPGFRRAARYGDIAVLEQIAPPKAYRRLREDGREPKLIGVDDRFTPTVRPRF